MTRNSVPAVASVRWFAQWKRRGCSIPSCHVFTLAHVDQKTAMSIACRFCEDTPCISACPREALTMDEANGIIRVDKIRCTGCGWCIEACDFGVIVPNRSVKSVVLCDLCEGRSQPKCIELCPKEALKVSTLEIEAQGVRDKSAKSLAST